MRRFYVQEREKIFHIFFKMAFIINSYQEYLDFIDLLCRENRRATNKEIRELGAYLLRSAQIREFGRLREKHKWKIFESSKMDPHVRMELESLKNDDLITLSVRMVSPPENIPGSFVPGQEVFPKPLGMPGKWEFLFGLTWMATIKKSEYPVLSKDKRILSIHRC